MELDSKYFKNKFNEKTRQYNWRNDVDLHKNLDNKSKKSISKCFKNLSKYKTENEGSLSQTSVSNKKKREGFKGITSRHLDFLNKTLGYATGNSSQYGRNNSASRVTSTYGKSKSRTSYLNSNVNNGSITTRLREID